MSILKYMRRLAEQVSSEVENKFFNFKGQSARMLNETFRPMAKGFVVIVHYGNTCYLIFSKVVDLGRGLIPSTAILAAGNAGLTDVGSDPISIIVTSSLIVSLIKNGRKEIEHAYSQLPQWIKKVLSSIKFW